jgi:hypothetical protein
MNILISITSIIFIFKLILRAEAIAQEAECLHSKNEALGLIPNTKKRTKFFKNKLTFKVSYK